MTVTQAPYASRSRVAYRLVSCLGMLLFFDTNARADGIDILPFLTRVGGWRFHPVISVALVVGLMLVNYLLNVMVIGLPSARASQTRPKKFARDLIGFTLLAQIADRVGAFAALMLGFFIIGVLGIKGESGIAKGALLAIVLNFVFSGLAIGFLALWYLRRRWGIPERPARVIAIAAGVITNPVWLAVYLWVPAVI